MSCKASGINEEGRKEIIDGIDIQTWLTGTVSDVITEGTHIELLPIFLFSIASES